MEGGMLRNPLSRLWDGDGGICPALLGPNWLESIKLVTVDTTVPSVVDVGYWTSISRSLSMATVSSRTSKSPYTITVFRYDAKRWLLNFTVCRRIGLLRRWSGDTALTDIGCFEARQIDSHTVETTKSLLILTSMWISTLCRQLGISYRLWLVVSSSRNVTWRIYNQLGLDDASKRLGRTRDSTSRRGSALCQRTIDQILSGINSVAWYLDDSCKDTVFICTLRYLTAGGCPGQDLGQGRLGRSPGAPTKKQKCPPPNGDSLPPPLAPAPPPLAPPPSPPPPRSIRLTAHTLSLHISSPGPAPKSQTGPSKGASVPPAPRKMRLAVHSISLISCPTVLNPALWLPEEVVSDIGPQFTAP